MKTQEFANLGPRARAKLIRKRVTVEVFQDKNAALPHTSYTGELRSFLDTEHKLVFVFVGVGAKLSIENHHAAYITVTSVRA